MRAARVYVMPHRDPASRRPPRELLQALFEHELLLHRRLFAELEPLRERLCDAAVTMARTLRGDGRLLLYGHGASAASCQQLAAQFNGRLRRVHTEPAAMALNAGAMTLAAVTADDGFEQMVARPLLAHSRVGDCLIAMSTGEAGDSVLQAMRTARDQGVPRIALLGRDGGALAALADIAIEVPHDDPARVHEAHLFIGHTWCAQVGQALER